MDYEKKYNEALERAKQKIDAGFLAEDDLSYIFPELRESEDERIRKGLVKLLTVASEAYLVESTGIKKDSYLAYLEKQKEQKPEERFKEAREKYQVEWSEEDEAHLKSVISTIEMCMKDCERAVAVLGYYESDIAWLKSLRPSWKPNENQMANLINIRNYVARVSGYWGEVLDLLIEDLKKLM